MSIAPDLTTLGKIVGGGLPVGAIAGPAAHMSQLSPTGPIYQAGTLSGNPLSVAAGLATLRILRDHETEIYEALEATGARLENVVSTALEKKGISHQIPRVGAMFCIYFTDGPVRNFSDAHKGNAELF